MSDNKMNLENLIFSQKGRLELSNSDVAKKMSGLMGESISAEGVGHYFTQNAGIPLGKLQAFLTSLGLKVVQQNRICLKPSMLAALSELARERMDFPMGGDWTDE